MAVPHFNYYPPAGQVVDASDGRVSWDGKSWKLNGRKYGVPSSHSLVGKSGTSMSGWSYDWKKRAWMEPSAPKPAAIAVRPAAPPVVMRPAPVAQVQRPSVVLERKKLNPIESLMKHPIAPVLGGVLVAASYLTDEPQPPPISDALPDATKRQWQMVYAQNQQRFARRMDLYKDVGMVLLGYSSAQTIIDAFGSREIAMTLPTADPNQLALARAAHRAI